MFFFISNRSIFLISLFFGCKVTNNLGNNRYLPPILSTAFVLPPPGHFQAMRPELNGVTARSVSIQQSQSPQGAFHTKSFTSNLRNLHPSCAAFLKDCICFVQFSANPAQITCKAPHPAVLTHSAVAFRRGLPAHPARCRADYDNSCRADKDAPSPPSDGPPFTAAASGARRYAPRSGHCTVPGTGSAVPRASSPP